LASILDREAPSKADEVSGHASGMTTRKENTVWHRSRSEAFAETETRGARLLLGTIVVSQVAMTAIILKESGRVATGPLLAALAWPWLAAGSLVGGTYLAWRRQLRPAVSVATVGRRALRPLLVGAVGFALVGAGLLGAHGVAAQSVALAAGDTAVVFDGALNLRDSASINANVNEVLADGTAVKVVAGPVTADGYDWYQVDTAAGTTGWVDGEFLTTGTVTAATTPTLAAGDSAVVIDGSLNLRDSATLSGNVVAALADGTAVSVVGGPVAADGYTWYQVDTADGTGWVAGEFLGTVISTGAVLSDATVATGTAVVVNTDALNLRSDAGVAADVLEELGAGASATVVGGPTTADGYTWYQVQAADGTTGWVAGEYLALA
jgi:uncharacterized protein YgiM (DUF1202 family)